MLFNVLGGQWADIQTSKLRNLEINCLAGLFPSHLFQSLGTKVLPAIGRGARVLDFVFVLLALVELASSNKFGDNLLDLLNLSRGFVNKCQFERLLLQRQFSISELHCHLNKTFLVLSTIGKSPTDVFIGGLVQVLFNVVESVLGNVGNTSVRVLPHISLLRFNFSDKKLDHRRFTGSVLSDTGDTGAQGNLDTDVEKSWRLIYRIGESTL
mmetsp:Transcript_33499/g.81129  ORF Transcript_33499/g.81129 Transcript_33499/m.81129 type:complete len:211 (+) Transcript_33499:1106-1738(+)